MKHWRAYTVALLMSLSAPVLSAPEYSASINYQLRCAGCHGQDGMGVSEGGIPPFPGFIDGFFQHEPSRLYLMHVPGVNSASLTDKEIAEVMNYVGDRWGEPGAERPPFTTQEVTRLRSVPVEDLIVLRRAVTAEMTEKGLPVPAYPWE